MLEILLKLCDSQSRMMTKYVRMVYCCIAVRPFYIKPKGKKSVLNHIANVYNGYVSKGSSSVLIYVVLILLSTMLQLIVGSINQVYIKIVTYFRIMNCH